MDDLRRTPMKDVLNAHKAAMNDTLMSLEFLQTKQNEALTNNDVRAAALYEIAIDLLKKSVGQSAAWVEFLSDGVNKNVN